MNEFAAFPDPVVGGYRIMMRFPRDGEAKPVLAAPDVPRIVPTKAEAWEECTRHLLQWVNGKYRCEVMEDATGKADRLFPGLSPIRRNGRVIEVESRRSRA